MKKALPNEDKTQGPNYINDWSFDPVGPKIAIYRTRKVHNAQIMDLVEIASPISIATCSLDHKIKLWDLSTGAKLGTLEPPHLTGVRCLDYIPDFSGSIVSVGHENTIKVWSPEVSIHRAYVGSLEGHNAAVMCAKFIKYSPYLVSIDEKLNIRVWDIRTLTSVQVITQAHKRFFCNGLCVLGAEHKFVIYGRRMIMYDTVLGRVGKSEIRPADDAYPFRVEFNTYYKSFVIATKMDVRIHDCSNGQLVKIFANFAHDERAGEITGFCMDGKHRKFYVGDAYGSVRAYNVSNGVFIKAVGEEEYMVSVDAVQKSLGVIGPVVNTGGYRGEVEMVKKTRRDHTGEISGLCFVREDQMLLTAAFDSTINVYDEENPEVTPRLRRLAGGHGGSEITCLEYSEHSSLIATGSSNGYITVWDYEMSRIEGMCSGHTREILTLRFVDPYPLLLSSSMDGFIFLWSLRGSDRPYACLCAMLNLRVQDFGAVSLTVPSMAVFYGKQQAIEYSVEGYNDSGYTDDSLKTLYMECMGVPESGNPQSKRRRLSLEEERKIIFVDSKRLAQQPEDLKKACARTYVVMGDEKGRLRILNMTKLINDLGIQTVKNHREESQRFNPKRRENNDFSGRISEELKKYKSSNYLVGRRKA